MVGKKSGVVKKEKHFNKEGAKSRFKNSDNFFLRAWFFIWYDDSVLSWLVNVLLAFLIVKFIFYPGLSLITGSSLPIVAVISPSMEHRAVGGGNSNFHMCGELASSKGFHSLSDWWGVCGSWYESNTVVSFEDFKNFPLRNGFNKGDIILIKGARNINVGDVVVFHSGKEYPVIHRVIGVEGSFIVTKGDNNPGLIIDSELDESNISKSLVIGKAYGKIPYLGYVKIWFSDLISFFKS